MPWFPHQIFKSVTDHCPVRRATLLSQFTWAEDAYLYIQQTSLNKLPQACFQVCLQGICSIPEPFQKPSDPQLSQVLQGEVTIQHSCSSEWRKPFQQLIHTVTALVITVSLGSQRCKISLSWKTDLLRLKNVVGPAASLTLVELAKAPLVLSSRKLPGCLHFLSFSSKHFRYLPFPWNSPGNKNHCPVKLKH